MAFKDFPEQEQGVKLLQRSLERGRLAHGYLFSGQQLDDLEVIARTLIKTLNCLEPVKVNGAAIDCCDACVNCRKIDARAHADVHWVRPESKSRVILIEQMRLRFRPHPMHVRVRSAGIEVARDPDRADARSDAGSESQAGGGAV